MSKETKRKVRFFAGGKRVAYYEPKKTIKQKISDILKKARSEKK